MTRRFSKNLFICAILMAIITFTSSIAAGVNSKKEKSLKVKQNDGKSNLEVQHQRQTNNATADDNQLARLEALALKLQELETAFMEHQRQEDERIAELKARQEEQLSFSGTMPTSCSDLSKTGHTVSGLYSVMGTDQVEMVHCNFAKLPNEQGFQTFVGYSDVKSSPVYFYVQRSGPTAVNNGPPDNMDRTMIRFDPTILNIGGAMNSSSGLFTAPRNGIYSFTFSGVGRYYSADGAELVIALVLNGNEVGRAFTRTKDNESFHTYSLHSTLELKAGDLVWTVILTSNGAILYDETSNHYTHFTGHILQENVASSFKLKTSL